MATQRNANDSTFRRCFSYAYSNRNGNVQQYVVTENQLPGQAPVTNTIIRNDPFELDFNRIRRNFFSGFTQTRLLDDFFGPSPFSSSFFPPQISHSQSEPLIEDISDVSVEENVRQPTIEIDEEEEWEVWDDWNESNSKQNEELEKLNSNDDSDVEIIEEENNNNNVNLINDDNELREVYRTSYLSLPIKRKKKARKNDVTIVVQLPNGKRVENIFHKEDDWDSVKQWVSFEMATDKSISIGKFLLENEYELAIDYPFTLLTSSTNGSMNIVHKISEFSDQLGKKLRIIIHRS